MWRRFRGQVCNYNSTTFDSANTGQRRFTFVGTRIRLHLREHFALDDDTRTVDARMLRAKKRYVLSLSLRLSQLLIYLLLRTYFDC